MQANLFGDDAPIYREELDQWFTHPDDARDFVHWCGLHPGDTVLEPSCGNGSLVRPLPEVGALVTACELDPAWAKEAEQQTGVPVHVGDFFEWPGPRQRLRAAIMNPPYRDGLDARFVARGCQFADRVFAFLRTAFLHSEIRTELALNDIELMRIRYLKHRPKKFGGEWTPKTDFIWLECRMRPFGPRRYQEPGHPAVELW